ncbi:alternate-type signal peptide domain-containing protein [Nocardioides sp. GY 10127]|uniref:alternate-type signal peptide domain-containing protein n=1 Tax=Nocardioides sp. GY 10127 TaxID=2569762 RepID=UPI001458C9C7|nr:alternate-type signal peptide domain-containing protein [Nocardioides sp. GY 10127]
MKNTVKGGLAAATAAVLLLGGGGSLAYWNTNADQAQKTITTGDLSWTPSCGTWDLSGGLSGVAQNGVNLASVTLVPGDVLSMECTFDISAIGTNLHAELEVSEPSLTNASFMNLAATYALDDFEGSDVSATSLITGSATTLSVTDGDVVTVDLNITFPDGGATDALDNMNVTAFIDALSITLTQV